MIRRSLRLGIRLGILAGIAFALLKLVQNRREASEFGSPAADWAPAPRPNANLPRTPPEPDLVQPAMLEEVLTTRPLGRSTGDEAEAPPAGTAARTEQAPAPPEPVVEPVVKKATPAKPAAAKKPDAPAEPVKKAATKKAPAARKAPAAKKAAADPNKAPVAKKAAPAKKAAKKQQP